MPRYSGKDLVVTWNTTDVSGLFREIEVNYDQGDIDATVGSDSYEYAIGGKVVGGATMTVLAEAGTAGTAIYAKLQPSTTLGTLIYYPQGTVPGTPTGNVKHTITDAVLNSFRHRMVYNAAVEMSVGWRVNVAETVEAVV